MFNLIETDIYLLVCNRENILAFIIPHGMAWLIKYEYLWISVSIDSIIFYNLHDEANWVHRIYLTQHSSCERNLPPSHLTVELRWCIVKFVSHCDFRNVPLFSLCQKTQPYFCQSNFQSDACAKYLVSKKEFKHENVSPIFVLNGQLNLFSFFFPWNFLC